ncbi:hypothetical protein KDW_58440 [Dictyobacter vulcani]|uniref:Uncharacterized protein n=1 Tax=Dictyobacter vulcani TaxID=2607529 RepID=A0A5J4KX06_9CHLR|nr:hypothetical protein KDW_58440 [Dictyobacter vulcani]
MLLGHRLHQILRIMGDLVRQDMDPRAAEQTGEDLPDRDIEAVRSRLRDTVVFRDV